MGFTVVFAGDVLVVMDEGEFGVGWVLLVFGVRFFELMMGLGARFYCCGVVVEQQMVWGEIRFVWFADVLL